MIVALPGLFSYLFSYFMYGRCGGGGGGGGVKGRNPAIVSNIVGIRSST